MNSSRNQLYPVFLKLDKLPTLIVGGGLVALEKLSFLLKSSPNANVTLVAPGILPEIEMLASVFTGVRLKYKRFTDEDLHGSRIVIIATDDHELNRLIKEKAEKKSIPANVADTPELCDFYLGSIVTKGDLKIAISTNGKSPGFAKRFREMLEDTLPAELPGLLNNLNSIRKSLSGNFAEKVKALNKLTSGLIIKKEDPRPGFTFDPAEENHVVFTL